MRRLFTLLVLTAACGHLLPGGVRCPSAGGPAWRELRSAHFSLQTDLPDAQAAQWVRDLEQLQATVVAALTTGKPDIPSVRVVVPASLATYKELAPPNALAYFTDTNLFNEPTIVVYSQALKNDPETIAHELAHHVSYHLFPRHPTWFEEGLAWFASSVANPDPRFHNMAGAVPRLIGGELMTVDPVSLVDLFTWHGRDAGELEVWAWLLYTWLWNNRPEQLDAYQKKLLANASWRDAWVTAFPEFDPRKPGAFARLEELLEHERREGKFDYFYEVKASADAGFTTRAISAAEVHVLLLDVRWRWRVEGRSAGVRDNRVNIQRQQLEFALQDDPNDAVAGFLLRNLDGQPQLAGARASVLAHPNDWRAQLVLADSAERGSAEQEGALRKAVQLNPDSFFAYNALATLVLPSHPEEAIGYARRAVRLAPENAFALETLGAAAAALHRCAEAQPILDRAGDAIERAPNDALAAKVESDRAACAK